MDRDPPPPADPPGAKPPRRGRLRQDFAGQKDLHLDPITRNLRKAYDDVAAEPLPEELAALLRQIENKSGGENGR